MKTKGINKKQSQEKISELGLLTTPERLVWWMESCEVSVGRKKKSCGMEEECERKRHTETGREREKKKPKRRSITCHSCQTLLLTAEVCPAVWLLLTGPFISQT